MKRYAETTAVPIARSRDEIQRVLANWGAKQVQWGDDFEHGAVLLRFIWQKGDQRLQARIIVRLQPMAEIRKQAGETKWRPPFPSKLEKLLNARGKREHRVLLLWLKAAFNAIELGIITAEELFLPWMEGADGATVAEMALPAIGGLLAPGGGRNLLPPVGGTHG